MHISIEHFDGKYPSFNINLHTDEDSEAFLSIKGCRIQQGKDGDFISYPATKNSASGKWWNHVWGSEKFNSAVMKKAERTTEKPKQAKSAKTDEMDW